jgi:hypothetical protein
MNTFVLGALALTAAGGGTAPGAETESEWISLDRELATLASTVQDRDEDGFRIGGFIRTSFAYSDDVDADPLTMEDEELGGFSLNNARVNISGSVGDYSLFIQLEGSTSRQSDLGLLNLVDLGMPGIDPSDFLGGLRYVDSPDGVGVLDAYADFYITDEIKGRMGNFRPPVLSSALLDENELLFINRTINGEIWDFRDLGLQLNGAFDRLGWWVAIQNGADLQADELAFSGRITFNALGDAATRDVEGAYGSDEENDLLLGVAYYQDESLDDADALAAEVAFTMQQFGLSGEVVDYGVDDDDFNGTDIDLDNTPWSATASFMFVPEQWEAAVRWEDIDDDADTTIFTGGVNYYVEGHDAKWQLNYSSFDSDDNDIDSDIVALALVVAI